MAIWNKKRNLLKKDIAPDEIFLDDKNMPGFDVQQFEGRIERPISRSSIYILGFIFLIIMLLFWWKVGQLQVHKGEYYANQSIKNRLDEIYIFPERGTVYDRNKKPLAWNLPNEIGNTDFAKRKYIELSGFGHILGYLGYPLKDKNGLYYQKEYTAISGIESKYHSTLSGTIGKHLIEVDAKGDVIWASTIIPPTPGKDINLSIDTDMQHEMHEIIGSISVKGDWKGGAGAVVDINTGELLALTSFPEFSSNVMTERTDKELMAKYYSDKRSPFMNRAVVGSFTPGSIVKPLLALASLQEKLITKNTVITSTGRLTIPNPYFPDKPSIFTDWKAHGSMTVKEGIAFSSNVFFYELGGGFGSQKGLGIERLERWYREFSYGSKTGIDLEGEAVGTLPNPKWKEKSFNGDPWRLGDTYFTSIGQYGVQISLLQALVSASAIANNGKIITPHLIKETEFPTRDLPIDKKHFEIVQDGMRASVTKGTANVLAINGVRIAAKTGTAELGVSKKRVNSWVIGFFPYENPKYAFALVMEHGVKGDTKNASYTMRKFFDWLAIERPTMLGLKEKLPEQEKEEEVEGHDDEAIAPSPLETHSSSTIVEGSTATVAE
jgi:penicillin-binding protein 2